MHRSFIHLIVIAAAGCTLLLPAILYGFPAYSHDGWIHALWSANFSTQLAAGEPYPRWLSGMNRGLGSPAFFFYPPLPNYLASFFRLFSRDAQGWLPLGFTAAAAVIAAGVCAYFWLRRLVGDVAALAAAVFYAALPYHLIVDLYIRGALAELFAFVWMPLMMYFILRFEDRPQLAWVGLAVSYALLIFSHLPSAMIFSPLPLAYASVAAAPAEPKHRSMQTISALAAGAGLSAIYLLPAVTMRGLVSMQQMQLPATYFENWFLFSTFSPRELNAQITLITLVTLGFAICFSIVALRLSEKWLKREATFWLCATLLAFLMMTPVSAPLWKLLPILQNIQFPFRFNALLAVSATALFALASHSIVKATAVNSRWKLFGRIVTASSLALFFLATAAYGWRQYSIHGQLNAANSDLVTNDIDAPEYRPRWASRDHLPNNKVSVAEGTADVSIESRQPRRLVLNISAAQTATLDVPQFYFPGWQWRLVGMREFQDAHASPVDGLVRINAPSGKHQIEVRLNATWPERSGRLISLLCSGLLLLGCFATRAYETRY